MLSTSRQAGGREQNRRNSASSLRATYVLATIPWALRRHLSGATKP